MLMVIEGTSIGGVERVATIPSYQREWSEAKARAPSPLGEFADLKVVNAADLGWLHGAQPVSA